MKKGITAACEQLGLLQGAMFKFTVQGLGRARSQQLNQGRNQTAEAWCSAAATESNAQQDRRDTKTAEKS